MESTSAVSKKKKKKVGSKIKKKRIEKMDEEIKKVTSRYDKIDPVLIEKFADFPFSIATQKSLGACNYTSPTDIQKAAIGAALQGRDILGAAKTGSGKTLAFLIPVLELLWREKYCQQDGLVALIITPTRELAYQIYQVLTKVGKKHDVSAGLIIGGKDIKFESSRISQTNIVISTPGRLLQHMDETSGFDTHNLRILVLDEADRILDMGFRDTLTSILQHLPSERQTLLFSATQTKKVEDLALLSLQRPLHISAHEHSTYSTPSTLTQSYLVCKQDEKFELLFSFIRHHLKAKILVFVSACKEVKFLHTALSMLRVGLPVLALHGGMAQIKRMSVYDTFCRKRHVLLIATDLAARGLDFPTVDWVVQMDCPEDAETYIHRVGRTARYIEGGEALLLLLPSEVDEMSRRLESGKIPIDKIEVNPNKMRSVSKKLEALCAENLHLKEQAKRCFVSYIKSVFLMKDKSIFKVDEIDLDSYARSLGLVTCPRVRFIEKRKKQVGKLKDERGQSKTSIVVADVDDGDDLLVKKSGKKKVDMEGDLPEILDGKKWESEESSFFQVAEDDTINTLSSKSNRDKPITKVTVAKKLMKNKTALNKRKVFRSDDEEEEEDEVEDEQLVEGLNLGEAEMMMRTTDLEDKKRWNSKMKMRRQEEKARRKAANKDTDEINDDDIEDEKAVVKRKMENPKDHLSPNKKTRARENRNESVEDEEEFALHLLQS